MNVRVHSVHVISSKSVRRARLVSAVAISSIYFVAESRYLIGIVAASKCCFRKVFAIVLQQIELSTRGRYINKPNSIIDCCAGPNVEQQSLDQTFKCTGYQPNFPADSVYRLSAEEAFDLQTASLQVIS